MRFTVVIIAFIWLSFIIVAIFVSPIFPRITRSFAAKFGKFGWCCGRSHGGRFDFAFISGESVDASASSAFFGIFGRDNFISTFAADSFARARESFTGVYILAADIFNIMKSQWAFATSITSANIIAGKNFAPFVSHGTGSRAVGVGL